MLLNIVPQISVPPASFDPICGALGICVSGTAVGGVHEYLNLYLGGVIVPALKTIFIGVAVVYCAWYALTLIVYGQDEAKQKEQKSAFESAVQGAAFVGLATFIVATFAPSEAGVSLVDASPITEAINRVVDFIMMITGIFLIFIIGYSGARIIALQGNESEIEKQKKNFFYGLLGVVLLFLAHVISEAILPSGTPLTLVEEVGGMIRFLLEIIAGLAVIAFIASGILFLVSMHNDNLKQRARRILLSTIIILIIVVLSHVLVSTFIPVTVPPTPDLGLPNVINP